MEGRGRRRCKSRKPMVTASFFTFLFFSCLRSVSRSYMTYSVRWHHQARRGRLLLSCELFFVVCVVVYFCDLPLAEARGGGKGTVMRCRRKRRQARRYATGCLTAAFSAGAHGKRWVIPNIFTPYLQGKASLISWEKNVSIPSFNLVDFCYLAKLNLACVVRAEGKPRRMRGGTKGQPLPLFWTLIVFFFLNTICLRVQHLLPVTQNLYWYVCLD